jgi:two-component system cell cycle sensor histidine kinase/response regulator CckA
VTLELEYYHKDGSIKYLVTYIRGIRNSEGKLTGIYGSHHDITESKQAQAALRESLQRNKALLDANPDMYFMFSADGRFIDARAERSDDFYAAPADFIGKHIYDVLPPDIAQQTIDCIAEAKRTGRLVAYNYTIGLHGEQKDFESRLVPCETGTVVAIVRDISDRKKAEDELRKSEDKYRLIAENTADLIGIMDMNFRPTYVSPASMRLIGFTAEEVMEQTLEQILTPESMRLGLAVFEEEMQLEASGKVYPDRTRIIEVEAYKKDGSTIWVEVSFSFLRDKDGKPFEILMVIRNITERKQAQAALQESEERYRSILDEMDEVYYEVDLKGDFTFFNESLCKIFGYGRVELMGMNNRVYVSPEHARKVFLAYNEVYQTDIPKAMMDNEIIRKNGEKRILETSISTIKKLSGEIIGFRGVSRDVTERIRAAEEKSLLQERLQQTEKMESIGTLAGGIAHDFNNLLMGIQGYASMGLRNLDSSHPNYGRLKSIEDQVRSGADLTAQLLGFARGGRYEVKTTNMNEILEKSSSMFGRTKKEITLHRKSGKDLWNVEVDRGQMEQVFLNLFVNAWQAMPGGGDIYLETQNAFLNGEQALFYDVRPGKHVKITVTDTGTGMDAKTKERIFEPFFTTKGMGRGTGLGLATVYGIIKGHGGIIYVYSEPDHGTTFTIYLPASEKVVQREETPIDEIVMGTETILLIDDEKIVMEVNKELLESMGYTLYVAGSGQEGLAVYMEKKDKIDLVILDMIMPGISGSDTFDRLRQINPKVKVLLSSGYSLTGKAQAIMDRGCNGFLQKPFKLEELSGKVREMLG